MNEEKPKAENKVLNWKGKDIRITIDINVKESVFGVQKGVIYQKEVECPRCKGNWTFDGTPSNQCYSC